MTDVVRQGQYWDDLGAIWTTQGRFDKALVFDGVNDWVTINDAPSLDLTTGMTLEAWVYPTAYHHRRDVLIKEGPSGDIYNLYAVTPVTTGNQWSCCGGSPMDAQGAAALTVEHVDSPGWDL